MKLPTTLQKRQFVKYSGQSLVEMAVIAPLLVLIFIGLIEVGWAILGYMRLSQAVREATRFAVRQDMVKLWNKDEQKAYQMVVTHFQIAGGRPQATVIIHRYRAFTGKPCLTIPCNLSCQPVDIEDDESLFWTHLQGITRTARINDLEQLPELMSQNLLLNCQKQLRYWEACLSSGQAEETCRMLIGANVNTDFPNDSVLIEAFYDQPQLTGFYWFINPIPLWTYTIMRLPL